MRSINEILSRGVEKILPSKKGLSDLLQSRKIRLYFGIDATGNRLHLGHTIPLRKLMDFADLGHETIFLFGTGTVLVGDPSQRTAGRNIITEKEIENNIKNWKSQVKPLVDFKKVKTKKNSVWLLQLTLKDIINIASKISAIQLFKREMFQRRIKQGDTIWYHETMYPLLQGYDSVAMNVDLEIGGTDQEFNMLIGRELQKKINNREKYVLTVPMIMGTDGNPMSKTSGNCIWLDDSPEEMYGKLMRINDAQLKSYFVLLTDIPLPTIKPLLLDPLTAKKRLAFEIVTQFHSKHKALQTQRYFVNTIQEKKIPEIMQTFFIARGKHTLLDICKSADLNLSHSQIKRVIKQGGVEWNGQKLTNPEITIQLNGGESLKFGKRTFKKASLLK